MIAGKMFRFFTASSSRGQYKLVRFSDDEDWDDKSDDFDDESSDESSDNDDDENELRGLFKAKTQLWLTLTFVGITLIFVFFLSFLIASHYHRFYNENDSKTSTNDLFYQTGNQADDFYEEIVGNSKLRRITIVGERNSGVDWLQSNVAKCFPQLEVTDSFSRSSHWFQSMELHDASTPTIVLQVVLNPYDWVDAMRTSPRNMPEHIDLEWKDFVTKSWTMERPSDDRKGIDVRNKYDRICQQSFTYDEVVPCQRNEYVSSIQNPVYELNDNGNGKPYSNILELRSAKIRNHQMVASWVNVTSHMVVLYEDMSKDDGFQRLIRRVKREVGVDFSCDLTDPSLKSPIFWKGNLDPDYIVWLNKHLDWQIEYFIGYEERIH